VIGFDVPVPQDPSHRAVELNHPIGCVLYPVAEIEAGRASRRTTDCLIAPSWHNLFRNTDPSVPAIHSAI
jgi:hypothetical protein